MPSDLHLLPGPRIYVSGHASDLLELVRKKYPKASMEGACGSYSFTVGIRQELVGEAWMHPTRSGWWLRIKKSEPPVNWNSDLEAMGTFPGWKAPKD